MPTLKLQLCLQQALMIVGGATESVFPQVEALLISNSDMQCALEHVAARKDMRRYESMVDFLFCEVFTQYRRPCFRYYAEEGPQLKDMVTPEKLAGFSTVLMSALEIAYDAFKKERRMSWASFRTEVMLKAA